MAIMLILSIFHTGVGYCLFASGYSRTSVQIDELLHTFFLYHTPTRSARQKTNHEALWKNVFTKPRKLRLLNYQPKVLSVKVAAQVVAEKNRMEINSNPELSVKNNENGQDVCVYACAFVPFFPGMW